MDQPRAPRVRVGAQVEFVATGEVRLTLTVDGQSVVYGRSFPAEHRAKAREALTALFAIAGRNHAPLQRWESTLREYRQDIAAWHVEQAFQAQIAQRDAPTP